MQVPKDGGGREGEETGERNHKLISLLLIARDQ